MTNLKLRLAYLDAALTGQTWQAVEHTARNSSCSDERFIEGQEYYLSDGGYSRVCWNMRTGKLFLTSNSREQVKALWDRPNEAVDETRAEVETECKRLFAEWAGEPWQEGIA